MKNKKSIDNRFNNRGYTPIRADKIEEVKKQLKEFENV